MRENKIGWLIVFYGIVTLLGFFVTNHFYTNVLCIYDMYTNDLLVILFQNYLFLCTQLNGSTYCSIIQIIQVE